MGGYINPRYEEIDRQRFASLRNRIASDKRSAKRRKEGAPKNLKS